MAEKPRILLQARHLSAVQLVERALSADSKYTLVTSSECAPMLRFCTVIWRTNVQAGHRNWVVDVGLPDTFPDDPPITCVSGWEELHLRNPHVLQGGLVCTIPNSAAINSNHPAELVLYVFADAERILNGTSLDDFREEFAYYWGRQITNPDQDILIVDPIEELGTRFPAIFCKGYICVASSAPRLNSWVSHWTGAPSELKEEDLGVAIHLNAPLLPSDYPDSLFDLLALAKANDTNAANLIHNHIVSSNARGLALLVQKEAGGVALGGISFDGLNLATRRSKDLIRGFRPGKVPPDIILTRAAPLLRATKVRRSRVTRVDHHWIHSRGGDGRDLSKKSVLSIGSGSLGGYVAHLLCRAGVGRLTVTDNDKLGWENLGRHILGASSVGEWKAEALANQLNAELPHLSVVGVAKDWRDALASEPDIFNKHDVIVSTVADWRCERPLNELTRKMPMPPLVFGWLEPHAVAGHCLVVTPQGGCFACAANEFGQFTGAVTEFKETTISKEPGGCTHYQHYGPTALMPVASMIASVVIECLLDTPATSILHTWVSSVEHIEAVGGKISDAWVQEIQETGYSRTYKTLWPKMNRCTVCAPQPP